MLNEKQEYLSYIGVVNYTAENKHDSTYLGRFTFDSIIKCEGLTRVLTIIARGFLFSSNLDIDRTRRALCAWCSIPNKKTAKPKEDWEYITDFREFTTEFPDLVNAEGEGWFYRHAHKVADFVISNPDKVYPTAKKSAEIIKTKWDTEWREKVKQFQIPIFSANTKGSFIIRFDDIIADALELGALRETEISLPQNILDKISAEAPKIKTDFISTLICCYIENKQSDSEWVVLPVSNFDAFFGTTSFSKKILNTIPQTILIRDKQTCGVCRYMVMPEFLP